MQSEHCGALSSLSWAHFRGLHLCWLIAYHCWLQNLIRSGLHPLGSTASNVAIRHLTHRFLRSIQCALRASSAGLIGREPVVVAVTHPPQFFFCIFHFLFCLQGSWNVSTSCRDQSHQEAAVTIPLLSIIQIQYLFLQVLFNQKDRTQSQLTDLLASPKQEIQVAQLTPRIWSHR